MVSKVPADPGPTLIHNLDSDPDPIYKIEFNQNLILKIKTQKKKVILNLFKKW